MHRLDGIFDSQVSSLAQKCLDDIVVRVCSYVVLGEPSWGIPLRARGSKHQELCCDVWNVLLHRFVQWIGFHSWLEQRPKWETGDVVTASSCQALSTYEKRNLRSPIEKIHMGAMTPEASQKPKYFPRLQNHCAWSSRRRSQSCSTPKSGSPAQRLAQKNRSLQLDQKLALQYFTVACSLELTVLMGVLVNP